MQRFVCQLSRWMMLAEVACVSGLCWDTVKEIVKSGPSKRYAHILLGGAVFKHLPGVAVVFDHFHVIKLINEKIDDLRRALQREADTLGHTYLKSIR